MAQGKLLDNSGEIDVLCLVDPVSVGDSVPLVFDTHSDLEPPFVIRVKSPTGALILKRTERELPTGEPQSPPPVGFIPIVAGDYLIEVVQVRGRSKGKATLTVA